MRLTDRQADRQANAEARQAVYQALLSGPGHHRNLELQRWQEDLPAVDAGLAQGHQAVIAH